MKLWGKNIEKYNIAIDIVILKNFDIDIDKDILENYDIDKEILNNIDINKNTLTNIDINKILYRLEFGTSNRARFF